MAIQNPSVTSKRQRPKEYKSKSFFQPPFNRKEPGEGSGAVSTYHRKTYFQIFWPSSFFVPKKQEARGLIALAALKGKRTRRTSRQKRPSSFLCQIARGSGATLTECTFFSKSAHQSKEESNKTISRFHFKKNPDQVYNNSALEAQSWNARGLVDGEPYGSPIDRTIGKWALVTRPTAQSPRRTRSKATCKTKTPIQTIQGKAPEA